MIFPNAVLEPIVQVNDRTRLDATRSFATQDEADISLVEIEPFAGDGFISVSTTTDKDEYFLDWEYTTEQTETVSVRITTDGSPVTVTKTLSIVTAATDSLLSNDQDLVLHEPEILCQVREGRNSFLDIHRQAQKMMLDWLFDRGWRDINGDRILKAALINVEDLRRWSSFRVLELIYEGLSQQVDDEFKQKAHHYSNLAMAARGKALIEMDLDGDLAVDIHEGVRADTITLQRS